MNIVKTGKNEGYFEITEEEYREDLASGLTEDETIKPGRHKFTRGHFRKRFPNFDPATAKTTVEIKLGLDLEVLEYFKQLAKDTNADSYQSVIKQVLQSAMEQDRKPSLPPPADALLGNVQFIEAVAERVKRISSKKPVVKNVAPKEKPRRRAA